MSKLLATLLLAANLALAALIWQDSQWQAPLIIPGGDLRLLSETRPAVIPEKVPEKAQETPLQTASSEPQAPRAEATTKPSTTSTEEASKPKPKASSVHCYRYGPVNSRLSAIGIMARLKENSQKQKIQEEPASIKFWLLAKADGGTSLQAIQEQSLGQYQGDLVLGVFTTRAQAQLQLNQLKSSGAQLTIKEVATKTPKFWILFDSAKADLNIKTLGLQTATGQLMKSKQCP